MAPHDYGTKVSFPPGVSEFDIPDVIQHLPVRKPQGVLGCFEPARIAA
jgi:hypothetical protein